MPDIHQPPRQPAQRANIRTRRHLGPKSKATRFKKFLDSKKEKKRKAKPQRPRTAAQGSLSHKQQAKQAEKGQTEL
jgi:hypothetical protein